MKQAIILAAKLGDKVWCAITVIESEKFGTELVLASDEEWSINNKKKGKDENQEKK